RKLVGGSLVGGLKETQEMIDFAAKHNVKPEIEVVPMDYVNIAMERLAKADVKYRFSDSFHHERWFCPRRTLSSHDPRCEGEPLARSGKKVRKCGEGCNFTGEASLIPREEEWMVEERVEAAKTNPLKSFVAAVRGGSNPVGKMDDDAFSLESEMGEDEEVMDTYETQKRQGRKEKRITEKKGKMNLR
ncbi:hypothetical protein PIB30_102027, partial [Stylosanthes scabra]|nr:hypothetical protein [Stylosanthes scabra]